MDELCCNRRSEASRIPIPATGTREPGSPFPRFPVSYVIVPGLEARPVVRQEPLQVVVVDEAHFNFAVGGGLNDGYVVGMVASIVVLHPLQPALAKSSPLVTRRAVTKAWKEPFQGALRSCLSILRK